MGFFAGKPGRYTHRLLAATGSTNAAVVAAREGVVKVIEGYNARGSAVYLKLYDKATTPDENDTPRKTIYLPASAYFLREYGEGIEFANGISYRMTTAAADNSTAALTANDILNLNIDYA